MNDPVAPSDDALTRGLDALHVLICRAQRDLFLLVAEADRRRLWEGDGARDMAHWLWMRYGVSDWKARRWIVASHVLGSLPLTTEAFLSGRIPWCTIAEVNAEVLAGDTGNVRDVADVLEADRVARERARVLVDAIEATATVRA